MGYLYKITSPSEKCYIGITSQEVSRRWQHHQSHKACIALSSAIDKYGANSMRVETLVEADWSLLVELEKRAIIAFDTKAPNGYNLTDGGDGTPGRVVSDKTREAISQSASARRHTSETKLKISTALKGRARPMHAAVSTGRSRPTHAKFMP